MAHAFVQEYLVRAEKAAVNLNGSGNLLTQLLDGLTAQRNRIAELEGFIPADAEKSAMHPSRQVGLTPTITVQGGGAANESKPLQP